MKCLLLLSALMPCIAGAANWQQVFGDYEYIVSVDADTIERSDGFAKAWVQQHLLKARHSGEYIYNILNGLNSFDCKNKRVSLLRVTVYQDEMEVDSYTPTNSGGNRPIIPGTVEYFAYQYLCLSEKK